MNLVEISTTIFLIFSATVLFPVGIVGWIMFQARNGDGQPKHDDAAILAATLFYVTLANLLFHASQFSSVALGALGYSMQTRVPIIFLIDGSLVILNSVYIYAYFRIKALRNSIK